MDSDKATHLEDSAISSPSSEPHRLSQKLANPLAGLSLAQLSDLAEKFCAENGFTDKNDVRVFRLGAQIAGSNNSWSSVGGLRAEETRVLEKEEKNRWENPRMLYLVVFSMFSLKPCSGMIRSLTRK